MVKNNIFSVLLWIGTTVLILAQFWMKLGLWGHFLSVLGLAVNYFFFTSGVIFHLENEKFIEDKED